MRNGGMPMIFNVVWLIDFKNDTYTAKIKEGSDMYDVISNLHLVDTDVKALIKETQVKLENKIKALDHYNKNYERTNVYIEFSDEALNNIVNRASQYDTMVHYSSCLTLMVLAVLIFLFIRYIICGWLIPLVKPWLVLFFTSIL